MTGGAAAADAGPRSLADLLTLARAARLLPGRPHPKTMQRWVHRGVGGVRLRHVRAGRQVLTTERWLLEFLAAQAAAGGAGAPAGTAPARKAPTPCPASSGRRAATQQRLRAAGFRG